MDHPLNRLVFREVSPATWGDFERLFESPGGPKNCWCMVWRAAPAEVRNAGREARKGAMRQRIQAGAPVGILGYLDDEPVAWCSIAPRDTYRSLGGKETPVDEAGPVWWLVCFFVPQRLRGLGISRRLIEAALKHARARGARVVEAYPVDPDSPSYRFMGHVPTFEQMASARLGAPGARAT